MDIYITRPQKEDVHELEKLFISSIKDAFKQEGVDDSQGIREEVAIQMAFLQQDFNSQGSEVFYWIARSREQIVGTIAYSETSKLIQDNFQIDFQNIPEIRSVYILPEFQGQGVGSLLFNTILVSLHQKNIRQICLDGGYKKSQKFWIKKLGNPSLTLKDYWGEGADHMIWLRNLGELKIRYQIN